MASKYLYITFVTLGYIFLRSGFTKVAEGKFIGSLGETLGKLASKNPYPFVKGFLEKIATPNSEIFGLLTISGELFAGIAMIYGATYLLFRDKSPKLVYSLLGAALLTGAFLNIVFWLAAGWTSPSTESLNLVMLVVQLTGLSFVWEKLTEAEK